METDMKKYLLSLIVVISVAQAEATTTLDKAIVECSISTQSKFEEISLNYIQTQDADERIFSDYIMKYTYGELEGVASDIFGRHPQLTETIFTSANANGDGVIANGRGDYQMIMNFDHSQVVVSLLYVGQDQDNFATYEMSFEGEGPAYEITVDRVDEKLRNSEHYNSGDNLLCVSHFNLDEFVTQ